MPSSRKISPAKADCRAGKEIRKVDAAGEGMSLLIGAATRGLVWVPLKAPINSFFRVYLYFPRF